MAAPTNLWEEYLKGQIGKISKVESGLTPTWETPEYKAMAQGLMNQSLRSQSELEKALAEKGITGGAASQAYSDLATGDNQNLLNAINMIGAQYSGRAEDIANKGAGREVERYTAMLGAWNAEQQREQEKRIARAQMMGKESPGSMCCFIFLEANMLTDSVRKLRDKMFTPNSYVAKGYLKMARWLVPIMRRNKTIKFIVRKIMTHPIAIYSERKNLLLVPVCLFWTTVWDIMGRIN